MALTAVEIFCSYSHVDELHRKKFNPYVENLKRSQFIEYWYDREIPAGSDWKAEIDKHLNSADIIALFVSPEFLGSNYCQEIELKRALERGASKEAVVLPILVRPCDWEDAPFARLQFIPSNAKPVTLWKNRDLAWTEVAKSLKITVKRVLESKETKLKAAIPSRPPAHIRGPMGNHKSHMSSIWAGTGHRQKSRRLSDLQSKIAAITRDIEATGQIVDE